MIIRLPHNYNYLEGNRVIWDTLSPRADLIVDATFLRNPIDTGLTPLDQLNTVVREQSPLRVS